MRQGIGGMGRGVSRKRPEVSLGLTWFTSKDLYSAVKNFIGMEFRTVGHFHLFSRGCLGYKYK